MTPYRRRCSTTSLTRVDAGDRAPTTWPSAGSGSPAASRSCARVGCAAPRRGAGAGARARHSRAVGLAAGFDKNAVGHRRAAALGFDFVEIGTVTGEPQPGNPRTRLFRLPADRALINRMGFNNDGAAVVARRLAARRAGRHRDVVVGVNIGKTKVVPEPRRSPTT